MDDTSGAVALLDGSCSVSTVPLVAAVVSGAEVEGEEVVNGYC